MDMATFEYSPRSQLRASFLEERSRIHSKPMEIRRAKKPPSIHKLHPSRHRRQPTPRSRSHRTFPRRVDSRFSQMENGNDRTAWPSSNGASNVHFLFLQFYPVLLFHRGRFCGRIGYFRTEGLEAFVWVFWGCLLYEEFVGVRFTKTRQPCVYEVPIDIHLGRHGTSTSDIWSGSPLKQ